MLFGDDRPFAGEEEQFGILGQVAHFVGSKKRAADMVLAEGEAGLFAVERPAHRLKDDGLLAEQVGDHPGAVVIVDAEDLQDAGVGEEGSGARTVGRRAADGRPEGSARAGRHSRP